MATYIRLTDYKSSDEKEQGFFDIKNRYEAKQEDFEKIPRSPIAYWLKSNTFNLYSNVKLLEDIAKIKTGMTTANNDLFVRQWQEINYNNTSFVCSNSNDAVLSKAKWFPYNKGGGFRKWYGLNENVINWENDGFSIKNNFDTNGKKKASVRAEEYYFNESISYSSVTSASFSSRISSKGFLFDSGGSSIFSNDIIYIQSILGSKIPDYFLSIYNDTINFQPGDLSRIPILLNEAIEPKAKKLTQQNINISKEEWDSRETSWDFTASPLVNNEKLKVKNKGNLEDVYSAYCNYWKEQHKTLHQNEEELNRLFIDIYELQDELTPDVELKDITILKNETKIIDNELVFQADEIMKQFISYGVGVMFGRYSLDSDGLWIANLNQDISMRSHAERGNEGFSFEIDDDNVIPVLEDDYFKDDIASRFVQFVKATFGEEDLRENIRFIESSLGTTLRKYFVKGFYADHIKRYKKRPIYWMVASPKKGFMSLIYMHRYEADTFARVRNSYLTEYIAKLEAHKETLALTTTSDTASNADKKSADKQMKNIDTKLKEIIEFDRDKMMSWSQNPTEIDLDDGVKVNYCKFKDILYPITGLCKK